MQNILELVLKKYGFKIKRFLRKKPQIGLLNVLAVKKFAAMFWNLENALIYFRQQDALYILHAEFEL